MSPLLWGVSRPADIPCRTRAAITSSASAASPEAALPRMKPARPIIISARRPYTSPRRPPATSVSPNARAYPDTTHWMVDVVVPSPACIDGIATLTMVTSSNAMKPTARVTPRIRHRTGLGWVVVSSVGTARFSPSGLRRCCLPAQDHREQWGRW